MKKEPKVLEPDDMNVDSEVEDQETLIKDSAFKFQQAMEKE
jgi:hypothetical protein